MPTDTSLLRRLRAEYQRAEERYDEHLVLLRRAATERNAANEAAASPLCERLNAAVAAYDALAIRRESLRRELTAAIIAYRSTERIAKERRA